ncbi:MAG: phosphoribosylglycinamide formyltransferase [Planctomycetota bacterium]
MTVALACLVSGGGRTVLNLQDRIEAGTLDARILLAVTDRACAAEERLRARGLEVERVLWPKGGTAAQYGERVWPVLEAKGPDLVCMCGFLRLLQIPERREGRIMNIHPGLLPAFGGPGMYGERVHAAVLESGAPISGCTVHFADDRYDQGPIILQRPVPVLPDDTVETLAARVFEEECRAYPEAIALFGAGRLRLEGHRVRILDG